MGPFDLTIHLANFAAPAAGMAVLMLIFSLFRKRSQAFSLARYAQTAINFIVSLATLAAGLWFYGRDGMMATYAAMVVAVATSQWVMERGWRG
jgi:hypothetical protein